MLRIHRNWFNRSKLSHLSWLRVVGLVSCFILVLTLGVMLFPSLPDSAQAVEGDSSVSTYATGTSVSIGIPSTIAFDAVTPTASGATTTANTNLTIATTNSASYSLYLYSSDGDNSLKSINPANTSTVDAINNGGVGLTLSSLEPNTWGYSLGTSEPTDTTTYSAVPTSNAEPIQTKDTSATTSANDTYTLSFGAKVDTSIPSGTYTGTLTVAVVAEPGGIVINYDANGGYFSGNSVQTINSVYYDVQELSTETYNQQDVDYYNDIITIPGATSLIVDVHCVGAPQAPAYVIIPSSGAIVAQCYIDTPVNDTLIIPGDSVKFYGSQAYIMATHYIDANVTGYAITTTSGAEELTPTRTGYNFAGWYTDAAGTEGNEFVPNGNMTSGTTVYAKWEELSMQTFTNELCQNLASDANYTVKDIRDGSDYTVRYINGNCWMTQNLRLSGDRTLTSSDSNVASSWDFPNTQLAGNNETYTEPQSTISSSIFYGGYYNFCAASAGTVCQGDYAQDATYDICPKGWRLPTSSETSGGFDSYASIFSPVHSGYYTYGSLVMADSLGYWWFSTADNSNSQDGMSSYNGSLGLNGNGRRSFGYSIRCVL